MPNLAEIQQAFDSYRPCTLSPEGRRQAGVAVVLRGDACAPEVLFIERAQHPRDPWSGHMAFPGGRMDPDDLHARAAAERETREEVGLCLSEAARLGRLDDLEGYHSGRPAGLIVSAYVYYVARPSRLVPNHEVEEALWIPLRALRDPVRHVDYVYPSGGLRFPGILVGQPDRQVVWGLTYRFLEGFFQVVGRPLPPRHEG